jgi:hypothetical protein
MLLARVDTQISEHSYLHCPLTGVDNSTTYEGKTEKPSIFDLSFRTPASAKISLDKGKPGINPPQSPQRLPPIAYHAHDTLPIRLPDQRTHPHRLTTN